MRHIPRLPRPEILERKQKEWTEKFIESNKPRPDSTKYAHAEIKDRLYAMSHSKCFYCESLLKGQRGEIDHFMEVSEDKTRAFDWENLFLSCEKCNNKLPNKVIPLSEIINPCLDSDEEIDKHIMFDDDQIIHLSSRGEQTIKKFKLSSEQLDYLRIKQLNEFHKVLDAIHLQMIGDGRKSMNDKEQSILRRFADSGHCFSAMFRYYLLKTDQR